MLVAAAAGWLALERALAPAAGPGAAEVLFTVERGATLSAVARALESRGLVRHGSAVEWLARLRGEAAALRAGEYRLSAALAPGELLRRLTAGEVATHELVVPEGFTAAQIGERLEALGLASAAAFAAVVDAPESAATLGVAGPTLEGYLFPETYLVPRGLPPRELARLLTAHFLAAWREIAPQAERRGLDMRQVATLASIVERETGAAGERPLIASVFHNRLRRRMRLESDPTVIYGIPDFDGDLRRRDLENAENPYNTYRIPALPPGPIANAGHGALRAVVEPADTKYLYFVSRNDGTHYFSKSYREHVAAVDTFQRRRR